SDIALVLGGVICDRHVSNCICNKESLQCGKGAETGARSNCGVAVTMSLAHIEERKKITCNGRLYVGQLRIRLRRGFEDVAHLLLLGAQVTLEALMRHDLS